MSDQRALDSTAVSAIDSSNLLADIAAMPDHIEDALWRAESAMIEPAEAESLIVCGMGGSAIGADLAVAALASRASRPIVVVRGYDLPPWVNPDTAVLLASYSGSTEETLSCYHQACERGCKIYVASSGGPLSSLAHEASQPVIGLPGILQPRAAVAYGVVACVEVAIAAGIVPPTTRAELTAAAGLLRELAAEWLPDGPEDSLPKQLAREADGCVAAIYGAGLTTPIAYRWRCQLNENSKVPATDHPLPEANHNEICGWEGAAGLIEQTAWFLRDGDQHEREIRRIELTAEIVGSLGAKVRVIDTLGDSRFERMFSTVMLGDLASLYLAVLRGVDPTPVPLIEDFKDALGRPSDG